MSVTLIIVTFNNATTIEKCIQSISRKEVSEVFVIDNASQDLTVQIIKNKFKNVKLVTLTKNEGYAGGNNIGIDEVFRGKFDYILILNPDIVLEPRCISNLLSSAQKHKGEGIFGPKILQQDKKHIWSLGGLLDKKRYTAGLIGYEDFDTGNYEEQEREFISGTCMLIPRTLLEKGLRFYEPYFLYYEDVEFCMKAKKLGFPSCVVAVAKIIHAEESKNFPLKDYYLARNHLLFVERNAPFFIKARELIRLPKTFYEYVRRKNWNSIKGIRDYFLRRFGRYG